MIQRRISVGKGAQILGEEPETQELIMLNFVEIRTHLLRPKALKQDPLEVRRAWIRICVVNLMV